MQARKDKIAAAREYANIEEAREVWGYDGMTEEEFIEIQRVFEEGENYIANNISPQEYAVKILGEFATRIYGEIRYFEFEFLRPN